MSTFDATLSEKYSSCLELPEILSPDRQGLYILNECYKPETEGFSNAAKWNRVQRLVESATLSQFYVTMLLNRVIAENTPNSGALIGPLMQKTVHEPFSSYDQADLVFEAARVGRLDIIQQFMSREPALSERDRFESAIIAVQNGHTEVVRYFLENFGGLSDQKKGELLAKTLREGRVNQLAISHLLIRAGAPATDLERRRFAARVLMHGDFNQHVDVVINVLREANEQLDDLREDLIRRLRLDGRLNDIRNLLENASSDLRATVLRDAFSNCDLELMKTAFFVKKVAKDFAQMGFRFSQAINRQLFQE